MSAPAYGTCLEEHDATDTRSDPRPGGDGHAPVLEAPGPSPTADCSAPKVNQWLGRTHGQGRRADDSVHQMRQYRMGEALDNAASSRVPDSGSLANHPIPKLRESNSRIVMSPQILATREKFPAFTKPVFAAKRTL
jgi:hypothetical protein